MGELLWVGCNPIVCNPNGPHFPFGTWYLAIFDIIRLITILAAMGVITATGTAWARSCSHGGQRDRYLALAIFAIVVASTEVENIGNIASYRLLLSMLGIALAIRGLWRFRHEQPAEPKGIVDG